jgi:hypothetical protein
LTNIKRGDLTVSGRVNGWDKLIGNSHGMSTLGQKQAFAAYSRHEAFLNMAQTTTPITIIAAAKTIRKVLVSSAMERPFSRDQHNAPVPPDM